MQKQRITGQTWLEIWRHIEWDFHTILLLLPTRQLQVLCEQLHESYQFTKSILFIQMPLLRQWQLHQGWLQKTNDITKNISIWKCQPWLKWYLQSKNELIKQLVLNGYSIQQIHHQKICTTIICNDENLDSKLSIMSEVWVWRSKNVLVVVDSDCGIVDSNVLDNNVLDSWVLIR